MSDDVLIEAEHVSKKFCRSLKRSLWYGARDVASALVHKSGPTESTNGLVNAPPLRKDEFWAVKDVSFSLRRGECLGIIGHNGAGKSTLLKMLNGLIPPDAGRITTRGRVAALIELSAGFNPILTGRENIYNQAALLGFSRRETDARFDAIVDFAEIGDFLDMPVQNYSSGMRVRLGFAVAAQMEPDILIIDEVLAVGDVAFRFKCLNAVGEMMRSAAVVFVSHSMPQIFRVCTEVMVMDHGIPSHQGRNIADGVAEYLALFHESELAVSGSGEIRVESLRMQSSGGETDLGGTLRVPFGSDLRITATVRGVPSVRNARMQFLFWNAEMLPVMEIMGDQLIGHEFELSDSGVAQISASVPTIHLNAGKYTLSVISASPDYSRVYCRHDNAAHVQIEAGSPSGAHVLHVADWVVTG